MKRFTADFWNRVLAEYDAATNADTWVICHCSATFYEAYDCPLDRAVIQTLAEQFLSNTNAGEQFTLGTTYLFLLRPEYYGDYENNLQRRIAVRRDFLLWARDNNRDATTNNPTTP